MFFSLYCMVVSSTHNMYIHVCLLYYDRKDHLWLLMYLQRKKKRTGKYKTMQILLIWFKNKLQRAFLLITKLIFPVIFNLSSSMKSMTQWCIDFSQNEEKCFVLYFMFRFEMIHFRNTNVCKWLPIPNVLCSLDKRT